MLSAIVNASKSFFHHLFRAPIWGPGFGCLLAVQLRENGHHLAIFGLVFAIISRYLHLLSE
jgi:hypothetical protein